MTALIEKQSADLSSLLVELELPKVQYNTTTIGCDKPISNNTHELMQCDCEENNNCDNLTYYFHSDQLGSTSIITDYDGGVYEYLLYF